jgi:signal transduction histidine kinase
VVVVWLVILWAVVLFGGYLVVRGVRGFTRGFRQGLHDETDEERPTLSGVLFRTVLVTLIAIVMASSALIQHNTRDQKWPVSEGLFQVREAQSRGATWLDAEASDAIEAALRRGVDGNPAGNGDISLGSPLEVESSGLPPSALAELKDEGWVVGTSRIQGERQDYVAWRMGRNRAVFFHWVEGAWYYRLFALGFQVLFAAAVLSPFAALVAWYLNRRIVKPVRLVAEASVELAEGSSPDPIPEQGPAELATMAKSFNRLAARLDEAEAAQKEFVASVNHELKTPLTSLQGYGELLSEGAVSAEAAGPVVLAETARLERLVGDLLDAGRMGSGSFTVREEPVALDAVAAAVRTRYEAVARKFGISLEVLRSETGEAVALADEDRLIQVVGNLTENALRCTPSGGSVHIVVQPPATIRVEDDGPGLDAADLPHAFERFYLYERCGKDRPVGTGLGLSIVKELTETMGGSVAVASEVGEGTVFWVVLRPACGVLETPGADAADGV